MRKIVLLVAILTLLASCGAQTNHVVETPNSSPTPQQTQKPTPTPEASSSSVEYNIFYERNNQFGKTLYIQVLDSQKEYVVSVCKAVKERYTINNLYINFYTKDDNVVYGQSPEVSSFAYYSSNTLIFYETSEVVELK